MLESFGINRDFTPVPGGQRRYVAEESGHPSLADMPVGTTLEAQGHLAEGRFSNSVTFIGSDATGVSSMQKRQFLSLPLDRREQKSPEDKAAIDTSELARNEDILEMSKEMSEGRAEEIIRAVLAALYGHGVPLPENPFRRTDTFREAVAVVKAADLNNSLRVAHIPHNNEAGESSHIAHRGNIRKAVARLLDMQEHQE